MIKLFIKIVVLILSILTLQGIHEQEKNGLESFTDLRVVVFEKLFEDDLYP